jgi:hypothetical protein
MEVQQDFRDVLELFNKHKVDYITKTDDLTQSHRVRRGELEKIAGRTVSEGVTLRQA